MTDAKRMVPVREWSCYAQTHECDCDHCELPYYTCEQCAAAKWVDKLDAEGNVVMREATLMDEITPWLVRDYSKTMFGSPLTLEPISQMPRVTTS